jgi:gamma-polyglutamate biosynthesis protein CapA
MKPLKNNSLATRTIRMTAVGDVMLGDSAICTGYGFASRRSDPAGIRALANVGQLLKGDIVFGNLECVLSERAHNRRQWSSTQLRASPVFAEALRQAGFTIMNVANNHASQHGEAAFGDTVEALRRAGIACCGIRGSGDWTSLPAILQVGGMSFGFLGYCLRPRQYSPAVPPYAEGTPDTICADVGRLGSGVDHVVVSLHWGEEYVDHPSAREVALARRLTAAGASAVLGHHPHVARPVEASNRCVIAYSLGNFVSDMIWYEPLRTPLLLSVDIGERIETVRAEQLYIAENYLPVRIPSGQSVRPVAALTGMDQEEYVRQVERTVAEHRRASWLHALRNAHRFRTPTLAQLLARTLANKLAAVRARLPLRRPPLAETQ